MNNRELVKVFKAMGNERRFLILRHLFNKKELSVGEITKLLGLSFRSVSKHLVVLKAANVVRWKQVNLNRIYSLDNKYIKEFIRFFHN